MANQQKPTKEYTPLEILDGYYWLVTHYNNHGLEKEFYLLDVPLPKYSDLFNPEINFPLRLGYMEIDANEKECWYDDMYSPYCTAVDSWVNTWFPEPECLITAIEEIGEWGKVELGGLKKCLFFYRYTSDVPKVGGYYVDVGYWRYHIDDLFIWCTKQIGKDYLLHINGKQIACEADVRRVWDEVGIDNLVPSLAPEYSQHRKTLSHTEAGKGKNATEPMMKSNIFRLNGQKWEIAFNGETPFYLNDYKGLHYIRYALYNPGKKDVIEFVGEVEKDISSKKLNEDMLPNEGVSISSTPDSSEAVMDSQYKCNVNQEIEVIIQQIAEARENRDIDTADELEKKKADLEKYLSSGGGLLNNPRRFTDTKEKERKRVYKAINDALKAIEKANKDLYNHLNKAITRGVEISYNPSEPTLWE